MKLILVGGAYTNAEDVTAIGPPSTHPRSAFMQAAMKEACK
jgi:hypothetical protein